VDVALSLVVVFMVSLPLLSESGIFVTAPSVTRSSAPQEMTEVKVNIYITKDGEYILNEQSVPRSQLDYLVGELLKRSMERRVVISADNEVRHERVVEVLDIAKQHGAQQLAILRTGPRLGG
jgi:biopolymer transport protein ExbD